LIKVEHLTKRFANTVAVNDISFEVEEGEILGFLGPNGAGKTTTMRILTCFMPATEGKATVAGFDVFTQSLEVRKRIGYMPENAPLYPEMRVREYLNFRAKLKGIPRSERRKKIGERMEQCGVLDVQDRIIGQLSKGYRQRVALTEALIHDPKVLILDEPTIGLDPNQIRQTRQLIKSLGNTHTIILSTHILPEVEMTCGRVIIINKGRIVAMDTPENLTEKLRAGGAVHVEVRGPVKEVTKAIEAIPGVTRVSAQQKGDICDMSVETEKEKDVREDIFSCVARNGWTLREMHREMMTLEDVFVQITTREEVA